MSDPARATLLGVFILATSIWVGGYVTIAVVARVATRTLRSAERVVFFRSLGRTYLILGGTALLVSIGTGAVLISDRPWDGLMTATTVLAAALVATLAAGVVQARQMTRLRADALIKPADARVTERVRRGAHSAALLRAAIGVLNLALVALAAMLAT